MSKVSYSPDDAAQGFGVQAGLHRVVDAAWLVHQFPVSSKTGEQGEPFVCLAITYLPIDEQGRAIGEPETDYGIKAAPKWGETLDKALFVPAVAPGQPLPLRVGSKGPYLEAVNEGGQLYPRSKPMLYFKELFRCGFDQKHLKDADIRSLIGTEGNVGMIIVANDGTDAAGVKMKDTKITVFKDIRRFGYDLRGSTPSHTTAPQASAPQASHAPQASQAAQAAVVGGTSVNGDIVHLTVQFLTKMRDEAFVGKDSVALRDAVKRCIILNNKISPKPTADQRKAVEAIMQDPATYDNDDVSAVAVLDGETLVFNR